MFESKQEQDFVSTIENACKIIVIMYIAFEDLNSYKKGVCSGTLLYFWNFDKG